MFDLKIIGGFYAVLHMNLWNYCFFNGNLNFNSMFEEFEVSIEIEVMSLLILLNWTKNFGDNIQDILAL